ncbi:MAG: GCN5-related N-acetyltransferase [Paenibacillus sp.]|jgi:GNAT superfamily N-acetyltransferase|nr:GCN5-related N-acetyltransferase [Paenibacillus sp.]
MNSATNNLHKNSSELILFLEKLALNTWPAAASIPMEHWIFRASSGITKRANSVWTAAGDSLPEGDWLTEAERFYRLHGLEVRFHISDASPKELDVLLEKRGFIKEVPCSVMIANADEVIENTKAEAAHKFQVTVRPRHDDNWLSVFLKMEGFGEERRAFYNKLFDDIVPVKGFFTLESDGRCAAVGTSIVEKGWAGFVNVAVNPNLRGQGIGRIILNELAVWSRSHGANGLYLQVVNDNEPAIRLYKKAGYSPLYHYHYRYKNN